jgi:thioredoxin reductase (NADPH)
MSTIYDLVIVGAGPAGVALAVEACASGLHSSRTLILEKGSTHNWTIRQLYPEHKLTTRNYKGFDTGCEGQLCVGDLTKAETIAYFDRVIAQYGINVAYNAEVFAVDRVDGDGAFRIESSRGSYEARVLAIAVGIFGRPNRPKEYRFPPSLTHRLLFDVSSVTMADEDVLVVGGGDTAAEYVQSLHAAGNRVALSYRQTDFSRLNSRNLAAITTLECRGELEILRGSNIVQVDNDGGRPRIRFQEERWPPRVWDRVVYALGGTTPTNLLRTVGVPFGATGPIFDQAGETAVPGLFLIGDLVVGKAGGSINTAFNSAVYTMRRIAASHLGRDRRLIVPAEPLEYVA